jgi:hypothetical protein
MVFDVDEEDKFQAVWDRLLEELSSKQEQLSLSHNSLQLACENVSKLESLFESILDSKHLIPVDAKPKDKVDLLGFYVRVYAACIFVTLDDINFNLNGRILSEGRREEVSPSEFSPRENWHHNEFATKDGEHVPLSNRCIDGFVQERKLLKKRFNEEWSAIEVSFGASIFSVVLEHHFIFYRRKGQPN